MRRPPEPIVTGYVLEVLEGELEIVYSPYGAHKGDQFTRFNDSSVEVFRANAGTLFALRACAVERDDLKL